MPICIGSKEYKDIFVGNKRIRRAYVGDVMVYQYDTVAPVLTVKSPTGLSAGEPEYISSLSNYKVWGYATDAAGNDVTVYVNNSKIWAQPSGESGWWSYNDSDLSLEEGKVYKYDVYAVDSAGNQTETITRYVMYDSNAPTLNVIAPVGTSMSTPTYVQSDGTYDYTVSGTTSDASGIKSVTVNGQAAKVNGNNWSTVLSLATNTTHTITVVATDNADKITTITRYVRIESYYQQAARVAGVPVQTSLENTLTNSTVCTAISGNSTAYGIMSSHYKSDMSLYIENNYSDALNMLNFKCKAKTYLFREGNKCTNITGGWTVDNGSFGSNYVEVHSVFDWDKANSYEGYSGEAGGAYTVNKLQLTGFSKYGCYCAVDSGGYVNMHLAMGGSVNNGNSYWYAEGYTQNAFISTINDIAATTYYTTETMDDTKRASVRASDPRSHPGNDSIIYNIKGTFYSIWVE